jgi:branched-chain amino acid transport system substrate-binding protein
MKKLKMASTSAGDEITWTEDGEPNKAPKAVEIKDGAYAAME